MDVCEAMVCVPECGVLTFVDGQSGEGRITGEPCPCRTNEGIPTGCERASMDVAYLICHDSRCYKHALYKSIMGD